MHPFASAAVAEKFDAWPDELHKRLLYLRSLVFDVGKVTNGVGEIEECLKWNVPAYLTVRPKSGTTIRLDGNLNTGETGLYVHCQTTLIATFRDIYPDSFTYAGNRAIIFAKNKPIAEDELRHCISMALTYHLKK